jgi:hypothetical protein
MTMKDKGSPRVRVSQRKEREVRPPKMASDPHITKKAGSAKAAKDASRLAPCLQSCSPHPRPEYGEKAANCEEIGKEDEVPGESEG